MDSMLHALPKVELHCHLDGSLSLAAIRELAAAASISVPQADAALTQLVAATADAENLMAYLAPFDFIRPLLQTAWALRLAAYDVAKQAAAENVRYIEVRFAPELSMDGDLSAVETIQAVVDGLNDAQREFGIQAQALICGMRQSPSAVSEAIFEAALPKLGRGLAGADFAGNEADFPPSALTGAIDYAKAQGIPLTFHAGECHCPQNIAEVLALGIRRIGHGTAMVDQPKLIEEFVAANATVEMCLTSNLQTKAARTLTEFPFTQLRTAGANITINTDNRTVSQTTLTREYALFQEHFGVTVGDFLQFNLNAAAAAFLPKEEKAALAARLTQEYAAFL